MNRSMLSMMVVALFLPVQGFAEETPFLSPELTEAVVSELAEGVVAEELVEPAAEQALGIQSLERWTLDDGTGVVLVSDHRVELVQIRLTFPAGNFSAWFHNSGGSEAFRLQMDDPGLVLRGRADALAATIDLRVRDRYSQLTATCLKRDVEEVVALIRDVLFNTEYDTKELKRQKKGRVIGWKGSMKDPNFRLMQAGVEVALADQDPRRWEFAEPPTLVTDVDKLLATRDMLVRFPGRSIGFAGDLTREEAEALAIGMLPTPGEAPADLEPILLPLKTDVPSEHSAEMKNLTQVYIAYGGPCPAWTDPRYPAFKVANYVLGGHFFSRLYVALRHDDGDTYGARSRAYPEMENGIVALTTFTRADNAGDIEGKLKDVLATFHAEGISEEERSEAVAALKGQLLFDQQAPGQVLGDRIWEEFVGLPEGFDEGVISAAESLTLEEVNAAIAELFDPAGFTMVRLQSE